MKNLSLNTKIAGNIGIFVVAAIVVAGIGIKKLAEVNDDVVFITDVLNKRVEKATDVRDLQRRIAIADKELIGADNKTIVEDKMKAVLELREEMDKDFTVWSEFASPEAKEKFSLYKGIMDQWLVSIEAEHQLMLAGKDTEAEAISTSKGVEYRGKLVPIMNTIVETNKKVMEETVTESANSYKEARQQLILISVFSILAGIALAFVVMRAVGKSIDQVIENLDGNSSQVTSAAQQIASASTQLSQAATEQAASLEETSAAIEELNAMLQKNSENAKKSSDVSGASQKTALHGKEVVQNMIQAIDSVSNSNNDIMNQINESNNQISEIVKVIAEIGNKTKVINDIVFQTKLLSFNASVEAARAGEHGKGFAVVAEEVGNLAQMSGNAAKEISEMLEGSIRKVEGIVTETKTKVNALIENGRQKVEDGTSIAQECGKVLDEIVNSVSSVTGMVNEISVACQEQAQGIHEITKAVSQLDQVTQENAATSEEAASSAEELNAQADSLKDVVQVLIQTIKGGQSTQSPHEPYARSASAKKSNVVQMKARDKKSDYTGDSAAPMKKVVGFNDAPSPTDPRFEEV